MEGQRVKKAGVAAAAFLEDAFEVGVRAMATLAVDYLEREGR